MNPARERGGRREGGGGHTSALPLRAGGRPIGRPPPAEGTRWPRAAQRVEAPLAPRPRAAPRARARAARGPRAWVCSPFGAPPTARRRLPLTLSLERGGRGLTRMPPPPRGSFHGTGGKKGRQGAAARLLLAGEPLPLCGAPLGAACCCSTPPSALPTATAAPPLGGMLVVRGGRARPRATTVYPFDPIILSFPPPNIIYPSPRVTK